MVGLSKKALFDWPIKLKGNSECNSSNPMRPLGAQNKDLSTATQMVQRAKRVVSDSPGLVDFAIGLVNPVLNLPER